MTFQTKLALSLAVGAALASSVSAQPRPALVQDRDQAGRNFYTALASCSTPTFQFCAVTFPTVAAGKRLIITHVSGLNLMPAPNTITSTDLRTQGGTIQVWLPVFANPGSSTTYNYTINSDVFAKFDAGEAPQFITFTNSSATFQMVVTVSGYTVDIP